MNLVDDLGLLPQRLLGLLAVVDVSSSPVPSDNMPSLIPRGCRAGEKPAVLAVVAAVTDFNLVVCALHQRLGPLRHAALVVIGVNDQSRPIARELFGRQ